MTKFNVGDRVRRRGFELKGTCVEPNSLFPMIQWDAGKTYSMHPELLIKLKKKKKPAPAKPISGEWMTAQNAHKAGKVWCFVPDGWYGRMTTRGVITFKEEKK